MAAEELAVIKLPEEEEKARAEYAGQYKTKRYDKYAIFCARPPANLFLPYSLFAEDKGDDKEG